ncbi:type I-F CRISPR-associated helicase Cas3f [Gilliamella sp. BG7]|uniref:type I-F CRISPR-associated helicase Cas3f n=1 Tax=unclassified Gilliamella TaxID=2685620 RepID=UPI003985E505
MIHSSDLKDIQLITAISALLHDLGKATVGFQDKLNKGLVAADPYRHEWISLQLFLLMIQGCTTNQAVLERLANFTEFQNQTLDWHKELTKIEYNDLTILPILAQWIAWLIVSHHRMPFFVLVEPKYFKGMQNDDFDISKLTIDSFYENLTAVEGWVKNNFSQHPAPENFWELQDSVTNSKLWLHKLNEYATAGLNQESLIQLSQVDPFLLHISRLCLMTADYNYSSLPPTAKKNNYQQTLIANTYLGEEGKQTKQYLDEHLLGVAEYSESFANLLTKITTQLPTINQHKYFTEHTTVERFQWQNHAFDLAKSYQQQSDECGFFGVNMASTGCGKTLANGRIMYALSNPKRGVRFTIALGLRVLTLQTGKALRERLHLSDEHLAILVGGRATKTLFELSNEEIQQNDSPTNSENQGSESIESLLDEYIDVAESGIADCELGTIIEDSKARQLLYAPIVTCTIDHIIQASECSRGGKYIAPTLRLLTSDLILDEPDDFDQHDLPALARLVHLAGLFGSKVLLSSATLTPDLIAGLFDAYQAGRKIWNQNNQYADNTIVCGWFDEYEQSISQIADTKTFSDHHQQFVAMRIHQLAQSAVRRQGHILDLLNYQENKTENQKINYGVLAKQLLDQAYQFHQDHHQIDKKSQKKVSIGLMRFAHTEDVISLTEQIYEQKKLPSDTAFHIVVYHARQLLLLRSQLEEKLDRILNRSDEQALFNQPEICQAIKGSKKENHIFIVIGTPVTEVGRDHDYDWAIVEPSSMRSIIQLVGRVWRHRPQKIAQKANVAILGSNLKAIESKYCTDKACFTKPGFEEESLFLLKTHKTNELIPAHQLVNIDAVPRIKSCPEDGLTLAELEHKVMADLFAINARKSNYVTSYWQQGLAHHHCVHLQAISPFRGNDKTQDEYICQLDDDGDYQFSYADIAWQTPDERCEDTQNSIIEYKNWSFDDPNIQPWLINNVEQAIAKITEYFPNKTPYRLANEFCSVSLYRNCSWCFHPYLGFYEKKG